MHYVAFKCLGKSKINFLLAPLMFHSGLREAGSKSKSRVSRLRLRWYILQNHSLNLQELNWVFLSWFMINWLCIKDTKSAYHVLTWNKEDWVWRRILLISSNFYIYDLVKIYQIYREIFENKIWKVRRTLPGQHSIKYWRTLYNCKSINKSM